MASSSALSMTHHSWYRLHNHAGTAQLMIYDEIGGFGISAQQFAKDLTALGRVQKIEARIHSPGGDVFEGMAIYNLLKGHPAYKVCHIDGIAASMAGVIAMAFDEIIIPENAMMMIHKPWGGTIGDADDMRKYADVLDKVERTLIGAYQHKTGLADAEIQALLAAETWFTGAEAVAKGFADTLVQPLQMAAQLSSNRLKDFTHMPDALKNLCAPQGHTPAQVPLATHANSASAAPVTTAAVSSAAVPTANSAMMATPTAAPTAMMTAPTAATTSLTAALPATSAMAAAPTLADIHAAAAIANKMRIDGINQVFAAFPQWSSEQVACITDANCSPEQAKDRLLAKLGEQTQPLAVASLPHSFQSHHHQQQNSQQHPQQHSGYLSNGNLVGDSVRATLLARAGHAERQADNRYASYSLRELARASLQDRGIGVSGQTIMGVVGMALTHSTSDFGSILLDVANKSVLRGWDMAAETFQLWTKKGQLSDFKIAHRVGLGEFGSLRQVRQGAEYKYVTLSDKAEQIVLATYGEIFSITRQAIINDDMSMLTSIPEKLGAAARGTIGDLVYAVLTKNPKLADNKELFHSEHKNILTGAVTVETLGNAKTLMRQQKSFSGRALNIRPEFILCPVAKEDGIRQTITSSSVRGADVNAGITNPVKDFVQIIGESRLDDDSPHKWYLAAGQGQDTIEVAYLDGVEVPYIEQQQGFTIDGVATKVRIDAGVAPIDFRGLVRSSGE